ncbi:MAG TPA: hypothetical protein VI701_05680 [Anaerolineales bacterium]|nr:hypothetical protein [Anaerolineales bacterium]
MEAAFWVALTLAGPAAARAIERRLVARLEPWAAEVGFWSSAAYGVLPLYAAWITGAVIGRECGIAGISPAAWLSGIVISGLLLGFLGVALRVPSVNRLVRAWYNPGGSRLVLFDEPRWAFYRGAGAVAVLDAGAAQLIGLVLGAIEWAIRGGRPARDTPPLVWSGLVRLGVSAGLFALTHNLWLILLVQAAAQALLLRSTEASPPP